MVAGIYNLTIEQGATFDRLMTVNKPDGDPRDFSGYTARMQIRREKDSTGAAAIELTDANGRIELGGALGTVRLLLTAADTASLTRGGVYDIELIAPDTTVERLLKGKVILDEEVTR